VRSLTSAPCTTISSNERDEGCGGFDASIRVFEDTDFYLRLSRECRFSFVPEPLLQRLRASPIIEIAASPAARLSYLLRDYVWLGDDPQALADKLGTLSELLPKDVLAQWQAWALERALPQLFEALMAKHYDPLYARSQGRHLERLDQAQRVECHDLSDAGIQALASRIASLG